VSIDVSSPNTVTEDVPALIQAGKDLATAYEDVREQHEAGLERRTRQHLTSMEGIGGFSPAIQGEWEDTVASLAKQGFDLLRQAAENARVMAGKTDRAFSPAVEGADAAPKDADVRMADLRSR
jgi:hypothetical protein